MTQITLTLASPATCNACGKSYRIDCTVNFPADQLDNVALAVRIAHSKAKAALGWRGDCCPSCAMVSISARASVVLIDSIATASARFGKWRDSRTVSRPQGDDSALRLFTRSLRHCQRLQSIANRRTR
jgi:hypothetical protein